MANVHGAASTEVLSGEWHEGQQRQQHHTSSNDAASTSQHVSGYSGDAEHFSGNLRSSADLPRTSNNGGSALPLTALLLGQHGGDDGSNSSFNQNDVINSRQSRGHHVHMQVDNSPRDLPMLPDAEQTNSPIGLESGSMPRSSAPDAQPRTSNKSRRSSFAEFFGFNKGHGQVPESPSGHEGELMDNSEPDSPNNRQWDNMPSSLRPSMPSRLNPNRSLDHLSRLEAARASAPAGVLDSAGAPRASRTRRGSLVSLFSRGPKEGGDDGASSVGGDLTPTPSMPVARSSRSRRGSILTMFSKKEDMSDAGDDLDLPRPSKSMAEGGRKSRRASMMDLFRSNTGHDDGGDGTESARGSFFARGSKGGARDSGGSRSRRRSMIDIFNESSKKALARLLSNKDEAQQQEEEEEEDEGPLWFTSLDFFKPLTFRYMTGRYMDAYFACAKKTGEHFILKKHYKDKMEPTEERCVRRALAFAQMLSHENIVKCMGTWEDEEALYVVEEYASKGDILQDMLSHPERYTEAFMAIHVIKPLLEVLVYLHRCNIVHRTLFPEYIFFGRDDKLRVGHFYSAVDQRLDPPHERIAFLDYMAPEMLSVYCEPDENGAVAVLHPLAGSVRAGYIKGAASPAGRTSTSNGMLSPRRNGASAGGATMPVEDLPAANLQSPVSMLSPVSRSRSMSMRAGSGMLRSPSMRNSRRSVGPLNGPMGSGLKASNFDMDAPWLSAEGVQGSGGSQTASPVRRKSTLQDMDAPWLRPMADEDVERIASPSPMRRKSTLQTMDAPWLRPAEPEEPDGGDGAAAGADDPRAKSRLPHSPQGEENTGSRAGPVAEGTANDEALRLSDNGNSAIAGLGPMPKMSGSGAGDIDAAALEALSPSPRPDRTNTISTDGTTRIASEPAAGQGIMRNLARNITNRLRRAVGAGGGRVSGNGTPLMRGLSATVEDGREGDEEAPAAGGPFNLMSPTGRQLTSEDMGAAQADTTLFVPHNAWEWQPHYDEKVDIWQVGCLMHEVLCGCLPFEAEDKLLASALILWADITSFPDTLSSECHDFIKACLIKDPKLRPTAAQLLEYPWVTRHLAGETLPSVRSLREANSAAVKEQQAQQGWLERNLDRVGLGWMARRPAWTRRGAVAPGDAAGAAPTTVQPTAGSLTLAGRTTSASATAAAPDAKGKKDEGADQFARAMAVVAQGHNITGPEMMAGLHAAHGEHGHGHGPAPHHAHDKQQHAGWDAVL